MASGIANFLCSTELFSAIDPKVIEELAPELRVVVLRHQEVLTAMGDVDPNLYLVMSGSLEAVSGHALEQPRSLEACDKLPAFIGLH